MIWYHFIGDDHHIYMFYICLSVYMLYVYIQWNLKIYTLSVCLGSLKKYIYISNGFLKYVFACLSVCLSVEGALLIAGKCW